MKEITIENNLITVDGNQYVITSSLPTDITFVQYHSDTGKCLEEPLMTEVPLSKYQNFIDEYQAIIDLQNSDAEVNKRNIQQQIQEAKDYLNDTDHKVLPDYDKTENVESIKTTRQQKRELIRQLESSLVEVQ